MSPCLSSEMTYKRRAFKIYATCRISSSKVKGERGHDLWYVDRMKFPMNTSRVGSNLKRVGRQLHAAPLEGTNVLTSLLVGQSDVTTGTYRNKRADRRLLWT